MKKENQQTPGNALEQALQESIRGTRHARKLITEFVTALLQVRTSNLVKIANAIESDARVRFSLSADSAISEKRKSTFD